MLDELRHSIPLDTLVFDYTEFGIEKMDLIEGKTYHELLGVSLILLSHSKFENGAHY